MTAKVRMGMVGGGPGAFIGGVHRMACAITGEIELVAGAFSRSADASRAFGADMGIAPGRSYGSYQDMFAGEADLPESERMQFVSIVTPNDTHAPIAAAAMEAGFHVICDKPLAGILEDALAIEESVKANGRLFGLTQTYTGYPLVIEARHLVEKGVIGNVRRIAVSYLQDWLSNAEDTAANKQAAWRTDPARSGESGAFADIGTHAFNLVEYMTGQRVTEVAADLRSVIPDRAIDDDGSAMFRLENGAAGLLSASQVCSGAINALKIEIYGDKASLHWQQEQPNEMVVKTRGAPEQIYRVGANMGYLSDDALANCRTPGGHPEGYIEAFANIYVAFVKAVRRFPKIAGGYPGYATIEDGVAAMRFIRASRVSSRNQSAWTALANIEAKDIQDR